MLLAPIPDNEPQRLKDLLDLGILDTPSEDRFDQLTRLAVRILKVRQAKITLVDGYRQYFKSNTNIADPKEAPRAYGTCAHAINHPPLFIVNDTRKDERFRGRPDVEADINPTRFYAAVILYGASGFPIGTFCVIDHCPRNFNENEILILQHLADIAQHELLRSIREFIFDAKAAHRTRYDETTGLANKLGVTEIVARQIQESPSAMLAVLLLQIDNSQKLQAAFGPKFIDRVLCQIARRLQESSRAGDIIGRINADQFIVCLPKIARAGRALFAADRILEAISQPLTIQDVEIRISANIGISIYPTDGQDAEQLLQNAQVALDSNRSSPMHKQLTHCFFTPSMNIALNQRVTLEMELCRGLANNEFVAFYQPKNDLESGTMIGAESLIRWRNPQRGWISPLQFIPIAEETNLIVQIGEWILRETCRQIRAWLDEGLTCVPVAVNIAHRQIRTGRLPQLIQSVLKETNLPAHYLTLEITESSFIDDVDFVCRQLFKLVDMGIELALDDFGTGYSSLSFLRRLPVKTIKIDRAFVKDVDKDQENVAICTATYAMAQAMRLGLIAEGVETENELAVLRRIGYSLGQGYFFGKPMPAEEFAACLHDKSSARDVTL